jgi:hypothetical protein
MLATIRKIRTNRRIARATYVKAYIAVHGEMLALSTRTYGPVAWSVVAGRTQSGIANTGEGPVGVTPLVAYEGGMSASPECEAAAIVAANASITAAGFAAGEWRRYWDDSYGDLWSTRITRTA